MMGAESALGVAGITLSALLVACGQAGSGSRPGDGAPSEVAGAPGAGSVGGAQSVNAGSASGGDSAASNSGAGVANAQAPDAPANVSGRWAMFGFEDPVGVQLSQDAGVLGGIGCGVGVAPAMRASYCSPISGTISGSNLKFAFKSTADILPGDYLADLVVAADGKRMAGHFGIGSSINDQLWFAWLPVQGDDFWLNVPEGDAHYGSGSLALKLSTAEANDPRFDPNAVYEVTFGAYGLIGDLGAFFLSEMKLGASGLIEAGPVSQTVPELPVYVSIASQGNAYSSVTARLGNGHTFTFNVVPR